MAKRALYTHQVVSSLTSSGPRYIVFPYSVGSFVTPTISSVNAIVSVQ